MIYELGATIKELRKKQNMTQKELAQRLNVSEATICKYENNTATPPFETLRSLAVISIFQWIPCVEFPTEGMFQYMDYLNHRLPSYKI